jgi:hypothetical protein
MGRFFLTSVLTLFTLLLFIPAEVRADGVMDTFTFTENNVAGLGGADVYLTWQLPATPDPSTVLALPGGFEVFNVPVSGTLSGTPIPPGTVDFFGFFNSSLFDVEFADLTGLELSGVATMYSGLDSNPTFSPGIYSGTDPNNGGAGATLTISTPEPSSILSLCAGLLALAGALAVKKAAV